MKAKPKLKRGWRGEQMSRHERNHRCTTSRGGMSTGRMSGVTVMVSRYSTQPSVVEEHGHLARTAQDHLARYGNLTLVPGFRPSSILLTSDLVARSSMLLCYLSQGTASIVAERGSRAHKRTNRLRRVPEPGCRLQGQLPKRWSGASQKSIANLDAIPCW